MLNQILKEEIFFPGLLEGIQGLSWLSSCLLIVEITPLILILGFGTVFSYGNASDGLLSALRVVGGI